ncbi:MAG: ABC transporter permease, partial [Bacteroidales bacterium]|nr:ABC transporter permease [Bacteroidales bacterium]
MKYFNKKKRDFSVVSLSQLTWKKFKQEKQGMVALGYIIFMMLIAISGYLITPDSSQDCNHQQLEIALKKPGFTVDIVQIKNDHEINTSNWFHKMLFGEQLAYRTIPVEEYAQTQDSLRVQLYGFQDQFATVMYARSDLSDDHPVVKKHFWLGTDRYGRDVLSQLMIGSRVSLSVGFISILIALFIGVLFGAIAGYYRGKIDDVLMFILNVVWSIPTVLLVIAISFALGKGFWQIFIALGLTMWVDVARVVRGQVMAIREQEYVEACKVLGFSDTRIILKHILPNILGSVVVIS